VYLHEGEFEVVRVAADATGGLDVQLGMRRSVFRPAESGGWQSPAGTVQLQLDGTAQVLRVSQMERPAESYRRLAQFTPSPEDAAALQGTFQQAALRSTLTVVQRAEGFAVQFNAPGREAEPLQWLGPAHLAGPSYVLRIERDAQRQVSALLYFNERVRGLRYERQP
jgi:hypothetical protein